MLVTSLVPQSSHFLPAVRDTCIDRMPRLHRPRRSKTSGAAFGLALLRTTPEGLRAETEAALPRTSTSRRALSPARCLCSLSTSALGKALPLRLCHKPPRGRGHLSKLAGRLADLP